MWLFSDASTTEEVIDKAATLIEYSIIFIICGIVLFILLYLLNSFSLYCICKKEKISNGWLAFLPISNISVLGRIADLYERKDGKAPYKYKKFLPILYIILLFLLAAFLISIIFCLLSVVSNVELAIEKGKDLEPEMFVLVIPVVICYIFLLAIAIIYTVFYDIALWRVYAHYDRKNAVLFIVLSVLFSFLAPVFLFVIRNNPPVVAKEEQQNFFNVEG